MAKGFVKNKYAESVGSSLLGFAGTVLGAPFKIAGALFDSEYLEEVGDVVQKVSERTGTVLGKVVDGTVDVVTGMISGDEERIEDGFDQTFDTGAEFVTGIFSGMEYLGETVIDGVSAVVDGDIDGVIDAAKTLGKVAAVATVGITVGDVIGGLSHGADSVDAFSLDFDGDGMPDALAFDSIGDGFADSFAFDFDGDGIVDAIESFEDLGLDALDFGQTVSSATPISNKETYESLNGYFTSYDIDGDGIADIIPLDFNDDSLLDALAFETDGDNIYDTFLIDIDGDCRFNFVGSFDEVKYADSLYDINKDGVPDFYKNEFGEILPIDFDNDGRFDIVGKDLSEDGIIDTIETENFGMNYTHSYTRTTPSGGTTEVKGYYKRNPDYRAHAGESDEILEDIINSIDSTVR